LSISNSLGGFYPFPFLKGPSGSQWPKEIPKGLFQKGDKLVAQGVGKNPPGLFSQFFDFPKNGGRFNSLRGPLKGLLLGGRSLEGLVPNPLWDMGPFYQEGGITL